MLVFNKNLNWSEGDRERGKHVVSEKVSVSYAILSLIEHGSGIPSSVVFCEEKETIFWFFFVQAKDLGNCEANIILL